MLNVARERKLLARMIASSSPLELVWNGSTFPCCHITLKADIAATLYGIEDRYSASVILVCPEVPPKKGSMITLNGATYAIIGVERSPGDVSLRLDLREGF